jgi:hypothetical protein
VDYLSLRTEQATTAGSLSVSHSFLVELKPLPLTGSGVGSGSFISAEESSMEWFGTPQQAVFCFATILKT